MNTGTGKTEQLVILENATHDTGWEECQQYCVYADVNGVCDNMPQRVGRYSY